MKVECDPAGQQQEIEVGEEVLDLESRVNHNQGATDNHNKNNGNLEVGRGEEEEEDNRLLPEFSETLPHDWETIEGEANKWMLTVGVSSPIYGDCLYQILKWGEYWGGYYTA